MPGAFRLEVGDEGLATLTFDLPGRKANVFTRQALAELEAVVGGLAERRDVAVLVLLSAKPEIFIAGMDVDEIAGVIDPVEAEAGSRFGHRLFSGALLRQSSNSIIELKLSLDLAVSFKFKLDLVVVLNLDLDFRAVLQWDGHRGHLPG